MIVSVLFSGSRTLQPVGNISSYLLFNEWSLPVALGVEYWFLEGTAWSFACESDKEFQKLLGNSGLLSTIIPGMPTGVTSVLCTPFLRRGLPRWFSIIDGLFIDSDLQGTPLYAVRRNERGQFVSCHCAEPDFFKKRSAFLL